MVPLAMLNPSQNVLTLTTIRIKNFRIDAMKDSTPEPCRFSSHAGLAVLALPPPRRGFFMLSRSNRKANPSRGLCIAVRRNLVMTTTSNIFYKGMAWIYAT
jgi:hypothetical protein